MNINIFNAMQNLKSSTWSERNQTQEYIHTVLFCSFGVLFRIWKDCNYKGMEFEGAMGLFCILTCVKIHKTLCKNQKSISLYVNLK